MTWWQIVRISCDYTLKRSCRWKCFDCPWILETGTRCYMPSICCQHAVMFLNTWRTSSDMAGSTGNHTICSGGWGCRTSTSIWHFTITSKKPVSKACLQNKGWLMGILSSWMIIADILGTVPRHKFIRDFEHSLGFRPPPDAVHHEAPPSRLNQTSTAAVTESLESLGIVMNWLNWHDDIWKSNIFHFFFNFPTFSASCKVWTLWSHDPPQEMLWSTGAKGSSHGNVSASLLAKKNVVIGCSSYTD